MRRGRVGVFFFFFQAEDGIRDWSVTGVQTCALPISMPCADATGKMMLAHAASAQGIAVVETICGNPMTVDYRSIPAAAFTHPEISFVGLTEQQAKEMGEEIGRASCRERV